MAVSPLQSSNFQICFVCLLHSKFIFFQVFSPAKGVCKHIYPKTIKNPTFVVSKSCVVRICFLTLFLILSVSSYFFSLPKTCHENQQLCLMAVTEQCFGSTGIALVSIIITHVKIYQTELNSWLNFFGNTKQFDVDDIIALRKIKDLRLRRNVVFAMQLLLIFFFSMLHICFIDEVFPFGIVRLIAVLFCYKVQCACLFELLQKVYILSVALETLEESVRVSATNKRDVDNFLKRSINLVHCINKNIALTMLYVSKVAFIWLISSVTTLILNIFIVIKYHDQAMAKLMVLHLRTLIIVLSMFVLLVEVEAKVNRKLPQFGVIYISPPKSRKPSIEG
nr:PREDICTED: uncharacterized protein LOC107397491 [Tribolium castaneum]|eukprot:XP_015833264.1 PREDICTED: uncharacterized protein LOC107397491 [Tribolium castaneum]